MAFILPYAFFRRKNPCRLRKIVIYNYDKRMTYNNWNENVKTMVIIKKSINLCKCAQKKRIKFVFNIKKYVNRLTYGEEKNILKLQRGEENIKTVIIM